MYEHPDLYAITVWSAATEPRKLRELYNLLPGTTKSQAIERLGATKLYYGQDAELWYVNFETAEITKVMTYSYSAGPDDSVIVSMRLMIEPANV
jgi:uncharacterized protein YpbB